MDNYFHNLEASMFLAHSSTSRSVKRAHRANRALRALTRAVWITISYTSVTVIAYIVMVGADVSLSPVEYEVLGYLAAVLTPLFLVTAILCVAASLARGAITDDLNHFRILEADSVVCKIRKDAKGGRYSEDSLFSLQRARNSVTADWQAKN